MKTVPESYSLASFVKPTPPPHQSTDKPSPIPPARSPRSRSGRGSSPGVRRCGNRDSRATA